MRAKASVCVTVWIQNISQVEVISSLIGLSKLEVYNKFINARQQDRMCVFDVQVAPDQYARIKQWHLDNLINPCYVEKE